ncbi:MAG: MFS transporter [Thaumarchaeota archaeon]|nr:MFS transporter [Nitrososphaerota archaeon]
MSREDVKSSVLTTLPLTVVYLLINFSAWLWYALFGKYLVLDLGFEGGALGAVMMLYNLSYAVSALPAGRFSDIIESKKILLAGILIYSVGIFFMSRSLNFPSMAVSCIIAGVGEGVFFTSATVYAVKKGGVRKVGMIYGFVLSSGLLGEVLGSLASGYTKEYFGGQALFLISCLIALATSPLILFLKELPKTNGSRSSSTGLIRLPRSHKGFRLLALGLIFHGIGFNMISPFISVHAGALGLNDKSIGFVNFTWLLSTMITTLLWSILADKIGGKLILAGHLIFSFASWATYAHSWNFATLIYAAVFLGIVSSMDMPSRRKLVAELESGQGIGVLIGSLDLLTMLSSIPAPMLGGAIYQAAGVVTLFWIASIINSIGVPFLLKVKAKRGL